MNQAPHTPIKKKQKELTLSQKLEALKDLDNMSIREVALKYGSSKSVIDAKFSFFEVLPQKKKN